MSDVCNFSDLENDLGYLIWKILKIWQRGKHKIVDEYGITASQLEVLGATFRRSESSHEITQIILSQDTDIDPMTISTILRNLEKKKLIKRQESKVDTRARIVELTEEGRSLFLRAMAKVKEEQDVLFKNIDRKALTTQLKLFLDELHKLKGKYSE